MKLQKRSEKKQGKDEFQTETVEMGTTNPNEFHAAPGQTTLEILRAVFEQGLEHAFPGALSKLSSVSLERKAAGYQVNSALQLQGLRRDVSSIPDGGPAAIARALCAALPRNNVIQDVSVTTHGFIVIRVNEEDYVKRVLCTRVAHGISPPAVQKMKVVVDFSSPNIAKQMHVGHLRSTIIGDTICRLFEFVGHDVERINHVGDWGTQFGMLLCHLEDNYPNFLNEKHDDIAMLTNLYKDSKKRFGSEEGFKERAQQRVVALQAGDQKCLAMWKALCDISRIQFNDIYTRLNVTLKEVGESFYNEQIPKVIDLLHGKELLKESDGALCVFTNPNRPPLMVRKRDGGYGYDSTDMAAIHYRSQVLKADLMVYITDVGQAEHFEGIFDAAAMAGWITRGQARHLGFGLVQDADGQRFKTRDGDTVPLQDLLDEACRRMGATLRERIKEGRCPLTEEEVPHAAHVVGHASVKYFDLRQNPGTNYKFEYDKMLNDQGDTAVYLLYTRARINSILNKAEAEFGVPIKELKEQALSTLVLAHESEKGLAFELLHFDDVIRTTMRELMPNLICKYLSDVCTAYSRWNNSCKVLGSPEMRSRLVLSYATMLTIDKCLNLLGIVPLERI